MGLCAWWLGGLLWGALTPILISHVAESRHGRLGMGEKSQGLSGRPPLQAQVGKPQVRESRVMTYDPALLYPSQGPVGINVTYGGDPIPKSPFSVGVAPSLDLSKIKVSGLGESK